RFRADIVSARRTRTLSTRAAGVAYTRGAGWGAESAGTSGCGRNRHGGDHQTALRAALRTRMAHACHRTVRPARAVEAGTQAVARTDPLGAVHPLRPAL